MTSLKVLMMEQKIYRLINDSEFGIQTTTSGVKRFSIYERTNLPLDFIVLSDDKKTIMADLMMNGSLSTHGFVVSQIFYDTIKDLNLVDVQFIPLKDRLTDYCFMFFHSDLTPKLNYKLCDFKVYRSSELLDFNSPQDRDSAIELYKKNVGLSILKSMLPKKKYYFNDNFDIFNCDAFRIGYFDKNFYISENLLNRIKHLTGFLAIESDLFLNSSET